MEISVQTDIQHKIARGLYIEIIIDLCMYTISIHIYLLILSAKSKHSQSCLSKNKHIWCLDIGFQYNFLMKTTKDT